MSASTHRSVRKLTSVLDRLMDAHPEQARDRPASASETLATLRRSVHRDVEALLNARRPWRSIPDTMPLLRTSPLGYGVSDFTAGAFNDRQQQEALRAEIEVAIQTFEPRLSHVQVRLTEDPSPLRATLSLRIDALLLTDPEPEPISFDTTVETTTADVMLRPLED